MFDIIQYNNVQLHKHVKHTAQILLGSAKGLSGILGILPEFFLDAQDLVVFSQTFRATRSASFNLSRGQPDHEISNERILGFSRSVRHHCPPTGFLGSKVGINCFGDRANLVHLVQRASSNNFYQITSRQF